MTPRRKTLKLGSKSSAMHVQNTLAQMVQNQDGEVEMGALAKLAGATVTDVEVEVEVEVEAVPGDEELSEINHALNQAAESASGDFAGNEIQVEVDLGSQ